jgi:hypothetical protein
MPAGAFPAPSIPKSANFDRPGKVVDYGRVILGRFAKTPASVTATASLQGVHNNALLAELRRNPDDTAAPHIPGIIEEPNTKQLLGTAQTQTPLLSKALPAKPIMGTREPLGPQP